MGRTRTQPEPPKRFLRPAVVAAMLGYRSRQGLWKAWRRGAIPPPIRVANGITVWDEQELLKFLNTRPAA